VAAIGLGLRLALVAWAAGRIPPSADGVYYHELATRLADGQGYTWLWPDGAVTYAAHYPVGYPAALSLPYRLFGAAPVVAMVLNALLGALACLAIYRLLSHRAGGRAAARVGGLLVAFHPGLVGYTPALMTEGVTAALVACAAWVLSSARQRRGRRRLLVAAGCGALIGIATLVRPQCLLLAPLFGALVWRDRWSRKAAGALLLTAAALLVCAPWTLRNCTRMGSCALVSVNGGWNLLIGTDPDGRGGFAPLKVPPQCREVFDEAAKDGCFASAAWDRIGAAPATWAAAMPRKMALVFDHCSAPGSHLHAANPAAFSARAQKLLNAIELIYERLVLLLALLACWPSTCRRRSRGRPWRAALLVAGALAVASPHGSLAFAALLALMLWRRPPPWRAPPAHACAFGALLCVAAVHAAFFGAGRYQLLVWPLLCAVAASGWIRRRRILISLTRSAR